MPNDVFSSFSGRWFLVPAFTAADVFKLLSSRHLGAMASWSRWCRVTHTVQMAGGLYTKLSWRLPGDGRMDRGAQFLQGLSCEWVKVITAPTLLCPLALNTCGLMWCNWCCEEPLHQWFTWDLQVFWDCDADKCHNSESKRLAMDRNWENIKTR